MIEHRTSAPAQQATGPLFCLVLALATAPGAGAGETLGDIDTPGWQCNFCTYADGWYGTLDFGPAHASDADPGFADYRGIDDAGAFLSLDGDVHFRNRAGDYFDLYARDLGTGSRQLEMRGGGPGRFELRLAYGEIPKYRGSGTRTPYLGVGGSGLVLPQGWVRSSNTAGMSALDVLATAASLETVRKTLDAGLSFKLTGDWTYEMNVRHETKEGTRPFGAGVFTIQSTHFPAPVDYTTDRIDLGIEYSGERSRLRFGFSSNYFNNGKPSVSWENPFTPIGDTEILRAALEPDSDFHQFSLTGAFSPGSKLRITGRVAVGRVEQDAAFLPYSSNPDFEDLPLPRASLTGKLDTGTLNLAARLSARLSRKLSLTARVKVDDRDNRNPVDFYTPVITDFEQRQATRNRPYSFRREQFSMALAYRAHPSVGLNAGLRRQDHERSLQSVEDTEETAWWGEVNFHHWENAQLRLRLETSGREISPYRKVSDTGLQENILVRKFNLADRDRDRAVIELDLSPAERIGASLGYYISEDEYEQSALGLLASEEHSLSFDLSFAVSPNLSVHAFMSRDEYDSSISGALSPAAEPWLALTNDRFTTYGAGLNGRINDRLDLDVDFVSSKSEGRIHTDSGAGAAPFPELGTDLRNARVRLSYRVNEQWSWTLLAEHEDYDSEDWQLDTLGTDGISAILTMGATSPDYTITLFRLLASYRFR